MDEQNGLKAVVLKIYEIGKEFYKDDIENNLLAIYNRLNDLDQAILLKGILPCLLEIERHPIIVPVQIESDDDFSIDEYNQMELIKLKSWLVKCMIIMISFFVAVTTIYIFFILISPKQDGSVIDDIEKFFEAIFGL